ncbi:MAG: tRNA (adenosine(37)-N6)-threonylcarbamoyltransferase complex dimerization subunit type 1 TsaB [Anaerolineae bacterium]|nr:tRNA (adenosine(37)-N6)-threonylcarbamoyltransferase complex dimerization subunit type 1 TsaB [Anaerolineae bacterium]
MLLAIDTATRFMSVALYDGRRLWFEATWRTANNHTIELTPTIRQALAQAQITPSELTGVGVSQGPGSFTGLRIGLGVAKGLATAQNIPLIPIQTLAIVAAAVPVFDAHLVAVLQAGRRRLCAQQFTQENTGWLPSAPAEITTWAKLLDSARAGTAFAGEINDEGYELLAASEKQLHAVSGAQTLRRAGLLAELAWERMQAGDISDIAAVTPIYLHQPGVPHP